MQKSMKKHTCIDYGEDPNDEITNISRYYCPNYCRLGYVWKCENQRKVLLTGQVKLWWRNHWYYSPVFIESQVNSCNQNRALALKKEKKK